MLKDKNEALRASSFFVVVQKYYMNIVKVKNDSVDLNLPHHNLHSLLLPYTPKSDCAEDD